MDSLSSVKGLYTGKIAELRFIRKFLKREIQVYVPIIDVGVDFILKRGNKYLEFQVKCRTKGQSEGRVFDVDARNFPSSTNSFIIICFNDKKDFWAIPSNVYFDNSSKSQGKVRLTASKLSKLEEYKNERGIRIVEELLK